MGKGCITVTKYFLFLFNLLFFVSNYLFFNINAWSPCCSHFKFNLHGLQLYHKTAVCQQLCVPEISAQPLDNHTLITYLKVTWCCYCLYKLPHSSSTGDTEIIVPESLLGGLEKTWTETVLNNSRWFLLVSSLSHRLHKVQGLALAPDS